MVTWEEKHKELELAVVGEMLGLVDWEVRRGEGMADSPPPQNDLENTGS